MRRSIPFYTVIFFLYTCLTIFPQMGSSEEGIKELKSVDYKFCIGKGYQKGSMKFKKCIVSLPRLRQDKWKQEIMSSQWGLCAYDSFDFSVEVVSGENNDYFPISLSYHCGNRIHGISGGVEILLNCREKKFKNYSYYTDFKRPEYGLMDTHDFDVIKTYPDKIGKENKTKFIYRHMSHIENAFHWFCD